MAFSVDQTAALLERTPGALRALLEGLPEGWTKTNEGPETFSPYDVVGHLIHGEKTDWMVRARIIRESGESRPFDRYDRFAQQRDSAGRSLAEFLDEFARPRAAHLAALRAWNLGPADLSQRGGHPPPRAGTPPPLPAALARSHPTHTHQVAPP